MRYFLLMILLSSFFFSNCSTTYQVRFDEPEPELITTSKLNSFLSNKDEIKIVLRTTYESSSLTEESTLSPIFNTIEKELLKAGFVVRDRAVFNRISDSENQLSYAKLSEQTDTDLILELVDFDTKVPFTTNTYYNEGKEKTFRYNNSITYYGANAEFRVVLLKDNEFAGSYSFMYAPCVSGCPIKINTTSYEPYATEERENIEPNDDPFQYVSKSELELFMKNATQKLIQEIK